MAKLDIGASPDLSARGLIGQAPDPLRYDAGTNIDPDEVSGVLNALIPCNVRLLDVGCGTGSLTLAVNRDKHNDVICLEPDPDRAALARSRGLVVEEGYLNTAFVEQHEAFDVIVFADVLEHLADPSGLLRIAISALRPGGVIIASVPNVAHWTVRAKLLIGRFDYADAGIMDATHLRWFYDRTIKALFERNGLEVTDLRQTAGLWLSAYASLPFRLFPRRGVNFAIRRFNRLMPSLFGCQHVIRARLPDPRSPLEG